MRRVARIVYRLLVFVVGGCVCLADFARRRVLHSMTRAQRADWLQGWCRFGLRVMGTSVDIEGPVPARSLIVSNHLGYLDIIVYSSINAASFVSKREVRSWPLFGWIATVAGSIYIDRGRRGDTRRVCDEMIAALADNRRPLMLFPEGTSSDGTSVKRFHSSLFEAAVATQTPITAAYLSYEVSNGCVERDVCYWGTMNFVTHILRLFAIEHVRAIVRFAPEAHTFEDRKIAAATTHAEVVLLSSLRANTQRA
jgi:lyso-ornithine lipid O-acyltransferase